MWNFIIFASLLQISLSSPTTTEIVTTSRSIDDDETFQIATNPLFKISFSVGGEWTQNYANKTSSEFKALRNQIDTELREIIKHDSHTELPSGTFQLIKIFPSNQENFLHVTLLMEAENEDVAIEWKDAIENQILINNKLKLSEVPAVMHGDLNLMKVGEEEIEGIECENEFCKPIPSDTLDFSQNSQQCSPNEEIQRGKTSIFIFESQNCVDHIKNQFTPLSTCSKDKNDVREFSDDEDDPMMAQASEQKINFVAPESENDDQTIVVIKKRGNKVFIEI